MSGAAAKSCSRKRGAAKDGAGGEASRTDAEATMAAAAAAAPDPAAAAAGALGPADAAAALSSASAVVAVQQTHATPTFGVQPLSEQSRKEQRRSPRFSSPLDRLATVELQLVMHFLDTKSKLTAARCCRRLLQAADQPFVWRDRSVAVSTSTFNRSRLGSLIRQSLLRHAPIALDLGSDLPVAEVAAIPRLRELFLADYCSSSSAVQLLLELPSLQGLQTLRLNPTAPLSTLPLLTLPALHTLECFVPDGPGESADWSWLPVMPALTDLSLASPLAQTIPLPLIDAIGECVQLRSLRLRGFTLESSAFARLCSTPAMRQLRHLELQYLSERLATDEYHAAFSALAQLESLHLRWICGVDRLLPQLAHTPALRTLTIACRAENLGAVDTYGARLPSSDVLRQLLTAAPRLEVRLEVPASTEEWRVYFWNPRDVLFSHPPSAYHVQMDDQWHELQRMAAEMERVTIVNPVLPVFLVDRD